MTPETKVDALRTVTEWADYINEQFMWAEANAGPTLVEIARYALNSAITLAQQAAYERAAQAEREKCAAELSDPYPEEIFTPLAEEEVKAIVSSMEDAVPNASSRMHASWARHWAKQLLELGGCASALELALAQRELKEAEWWEHLAPDCDGKDCIYCEHLAELRARIADLSGQEEKP